MEYSYWLGRSPLSVEASSEIWVEIWYSESYIVKLEGLGIKPLCNDGLGCSPISKDMTSHELNYTF